MFNRHNFNQQNHPKANFAFRNNNLNNLFNNQGTSVFYPDVNRNDYSMNNVSKNSPLINKINFKNNEEIIKDENTQAYIIIEEYLDSEGISKIHVFDKIMDYIYKNEVSKNNINENNLSSDIYKFVNNYFILNNINHDYFINTIKEMLANPSVIGQKITYNWDKLKGSEIYLINKLSNNIYKAYQAFKTSSPINTSTPQPYTSPSLDIHDIFKNILNSNSDNVLTDDKNKEIPKTSNINLESRIAKLENIINNLTNEINELKKNQSRTYELEAQLNDISSIVNQSSIYSEDNKINKYDTVYDDMPPLIDDSKPCITNQYDCDCDCQCEEDTISSISSNNDDTENNDKVKNNDTPNQEFDLNKFMNNAEKIGKSIAIEFIKSFKLPFNPQ